MAPFLFEGMGRAKLLDQRARRLLSFLKCIIFFKKMTHR